MKKIITNVGKTMIGMGASRLGWNLIFRNNNEDVLKDEDVLAGAAVMVIGAGVVAAGKAMKDKEEASVVDTEDDEIVEIGI